MDDPRARIRLGSSGYTVQLNRAAVKELISGFTWLVRERPPGEEVSLISNACQEAKRRDGTVIGYLEFNLVDRHSHKKAGKNVLKHLTDLRRRPHGKYTPEHDRLDYHVNVDELKEALGVLSELEERGNSTDTVFGNLQINVID